jgi:hypothetical protein
MRDGIRKSGAWHTGFHTEGPDLKQMRRVLEFGAIVRNVTRPVPAG